jgi:hypothetical protein
MDATWLLDTVLIDRLLDALGPSPAPLLARYGKHTTAMPLMT